MGCALNLLYGLIVRVALGRLISSAPRIERRGDALVARTATRAALLTLGLKRRTVIVDTRQRAVRILSRYLWILPIVRRVPFDAVVRVVYSHTDVNPLQHWPWASYQELDMFAVRIRLVNGEDLLLCRFFGSGDWVNNSWWPDWVLWDDQLCAELAKTSQETESRAYATAVARAVGAPLEVGV